MSTLRFDVDLVDRGLAKGPKVVKTPVLVVCFGAFRLPGVCLHLRARRITQENVVEQERVVVSATYTYGLEIEYDP